MIKYPNIILCSIYDYDRGIWYESGGIQVSPTASHDYHHCGSGRTQDVHNENKTGDGKDKWMETGGRGEREKKIEVEERGRGENERSQVNRK